MKKEDHIKYNIGDKVRILPNHSCVVANLANEFCLVEGDSLVNIIPVEAGKTSHGENGFE